MATQRLLLAGTSSVQGTPMITVTSTSTFFSKVDVVRLSFTSDHKLMKDNNTDWTDSGNLFPKPDFTSTRSLPISHTKNLPLTINVDFEVSPPDAVPVDVKVSGIATWDITFVFVGTATFKGGVQTVTFTSNKPLRDHVETLTGAIDWTISSAADPSQALRAHSVGHVIFVTMGTPDASFDGPEAGITEKRMDKAVAMVGSINTVEPHAIVDALMASFPQFMLPGQSLPDKSRTPSPDVNWPTYIASSTAHVPGGAWNIADVPEAFAECQAIVRLVRAVLKQVGCPGVVETMLVFADADTGAALEVPWNGGTGQGLDGTTRMLGKTACFVFLTTQMPNAVGEVQSFLQMNNFEACLRFTHAGVTKYYLGGEQRATALDGGPGTSASTAPTKEIALTTFQALVWVTRPGDDVRIEKIVKKYR